MNLELFIARKIHFKQQGEKKKSTPPAIRIAIAGIALGLAVMLISVAVIIGFKNEIRDKVVGFSSHIQISNFDDNVSYETSPIGIGDSLLQLLNGHSEIVRFDYYATKPAILKTNTDFQGITLKGVTPAFDWTFLTQNLKEGTIPVYNDSIVSNQILLSKYIADKLQLSVGDAIYTYFFQDDVKARKFTISGLYETNFIEYDKLFIIGDVRHIQNLNNWNRDQYSGVEVMLNDYKKIAQVSDSLYFECSNITDPYGESYYVRSIQELNGQLFSWLEMLDTNVWVILILMSLVSGFTMISGLLILIMERINMIGILKAMGMEVFSIRKIFIYVSVFLIGKGMLWGNIIALTICWVQSRYQLLQLNPETYSLDTVPIEMNVTYWILLNIGSLIVSLAMLIGPSYIISLIRPAKSIKFE